MNPVQKHAKLDQVPIIVPKVTISTTQNFLTLQQTKHYFFIMMPHKQSHKINDAIAAYRQNNLLLIIDPATYVNWTLNFRSGIKFLFWMSTVVNKLRLLAIIQLNLLYVT